MSNPFSNWTPDMVEAHNARVAASATKKAHAMQKADDDQILEAYAQHKNVWLAAKALGMCGQSVWERLKRLNVAMNRNHYTENQRSLISAFYEAGFKAGELKVFCEKHGFLKPNVSRFARGLGLTNRARTRTPEVIQCISDRVAAQWKKIPHPRGFLGGKHSEMARAKISEDGKKRWKNLSADDRREFTQRRLIARADKNGGVLPRVSHRGSWKAAWVEIGGKRFFSRSRWEVLYAAYLEFLKKHESITDWVYESQTFWFAGIKRGTTNYTPDFYITMPDGSSEYHEVKGWMDDRSKTKIARMRRYHPDVRLVVRDSAWFKLNMNMLKSLKTGANITIHPIAPRNEMEGN